MARSLNALSISARSGYDRTVIIQISALSLPPHTPHTFIPPPPRHTHRDRFPRRLLGECFGLTQPKHSTDSRRGKRSRCVGWGWGPGGAVAGSDLTTNYHGSPKERTMISSISQTSLSDLSSMDANFIHPGSKIFVRGR